MAADVVRSLRASPDVGIRGVHKVPSFVLVGPCRSWQTSDHFKEPQTTSLRVVVFAGLSAAFNAASLRAEAKATCRRLLCSAAFTCTPASGAALLAGPGSACPGVGLGLRAQGKG